MSAFLLVHGAWHGGWCWHKVVARLEAMGHRAAAPDMPGHGDDQTPIAGVTLDHLVDRVCAAIDAAGEKVVLVGHSYGGAMISQAAERRASRIKSLVYLAAFLLGDGQSVTRTARDDKESHLNGKVDFAADDSVATVRPRRSATASMANARRKTSRSPAPGCGRRRWRAFAPRCASARRSSAVCRGPISSAGATTPSRSACSGGCTAPCPASASSPWIPTIRPFSRRRTR